MRMTIIEALQAQQLRIGNGRRWLYFENDFWIVAERKYAARTTKIILQTDNEENAVAELLKG